MENPFRRVRGFYDLLKYMRCGRTQAYYLLGYLYFNLLTDYNGSKHTPVVG